MPVGKPVVKSLCVPMIVAERGRLIVGVLAEDI